VANGAVTNAAGGSPPRAPESSPSYSTRSFNWANQLSVTPLDPQGELLNNGSGAVGPQGFRWLRKAARLPSVRLAQLLDVTPGTVSRLENGKQPLGRRAVALVSALALEAQGSRAVALDLLEAVAARKKPSKRVRLDVSAPG
jgi:hypothetical protein